MAKAIIFDLFGTFTCKTIPEHKLIKRFGLNPEIHSALVRAVCGRKFSDWKSYIDKVVEAAGLEKSEENKDIVRKIIDSAVETGIKGVFPETRGVLKNLKERGYVLGLVSDCYPKCRRILEENELVGFFKEKAITLSYEVGELKWDQEIYRICLRELGLPAEETVMVGDSPETDMKMSSEATGGKMQGILISSGGGTAETGYSVVSGLGEVPKAVEELE